jgi:homoserine O-acetyltransferase
MEHRVCELGDLPLLDGGVLPDARVAYAVHGVLDADGGNAVLCPSFFGGDHTGYDWLIGPGRPLDPERYFIVVPGLFGNGASSSPSNHPLGRAFPRITPQDNVSAQHRLLTRELGVTRLELVAGWSMGAAHAYQWAVSHPEMVRRFAAICGAAATSEHNKVLLDGLTSALRAGEQDRSGARAAGRVFAGWGASHAFWARELYRGMGFPGREAYLSGFWETFFTGEGRAADLLAMAGTWAGADIGATPGCGGSTAAALASIEAEAALLPAETDACFAVEDEVRACRIMPHATLTVIPGPWGHLSGSGAGPEGREAIAGALSRLLASERPEPAAARRGSSAG